MRVGVKLGEFGLVSVRKMVRSIYESVAARHELVFLPPEHAYVPQRERERMMEEFLGRCDVVVGLLDPELLAARQRTGSAVPFVGFTMGGLPLGAWNVKKCLPNLTSNDVLVVNCASDVDLARKFFRNAGVRLVPFPYDTAAFHPLSDAEMRDARRRLRFGENDRIILYAGRINPEKNVHVLLSLFSVIHPRIPDARLVLAGTVGGGEALQKFNVNTVWFLSTFSRLVNRLGLGPRIRLMALSDATRMRELYSLADVKVNLTLNPDENFGMAQLEAMACGTPVVGTAWGGLKDSIADGVTGYRVSTVATPTGVKLSWWEALNKTISILEDGAARERFRESCPRHAARYTPAVFDAQLEQVLADAVRQSARPAEPVRPTDFAEEFWTACDSRWTGAPFGHSAESDEMYRELATPYTGAAPEHVPVDDALEPDQVLTLATPVEVESPETLRPDHALYPFPIEVPEGCEDAVQSILGLMRDEPAVTVRRLAGGRGEPAPDVADALWWMMDEGLVLRTRHVHGWLDPATVGGRLGEVQFSVHHVDRDTTDLIVYQ